MDSFGNLMKVLRNKDYQSPEWQACVWAACFLMPEEGVRAYIARQRPEDFSVKATAEHFGVPLEVAQYRVETIAPKLVQKNGEGG